MKLHGLAKLARSADVFRKVLHTGRKMQVVIVSLRHTESTSEESYPKSDQFLYVLHGDGEALMGGRFNDLDRGDGLFIPAGTRFRLRNTGPDELRILAIFSPPAFPEGFVEAFRETVITSKLIEEIVTEFEDDDTPDEVDAQAVREQV